jgi:hypothetical protein
MTISIKCQQQSFVILDLFSVGRQLNYLLPEVVFRLVPHPVSNCISVMSSAAVKVGGNKCCGRLTHY